MTPATVTERRTEQTTDKSAIRPFRFEASDAELEEMRRRITATRFPEKETVADFSQGVPLTTIREARAVLGHGVRLAQGRVAAERGSELHHRDRRARHSLHSRALEARECVARRHHPRLAGLHHRAAQAHRTADQSHGARRQRRGRLPRGDSVDAGLRLLGQANGHGLGPGANRARLDSADEAPGIHAIRGTRRRLGRCRGRHDGGAGSTGVARHSHQHARHLSSRHRRGGFFRRAGAGRSLSR